MTPPLTDADAKRIYMDAFERAVRHASVHVGRDEALEIGHHVASALVRRAADPRGSSEILSIDAFIHRAVLNRIREAWRAKRRRASAEQAYQDERTAVSPAWTQPGASLESRELHAAIEAAIESMPDARREVFLLIRRDQRTYKEVAQQLGIAVGTVHTHLSRANASLREAIENFREGGRSSLSLVGSSRPRTSRTGT